MKKLVVLSALLASFGVKATSIESCIPEPDHNVKNEIYSFDSITFETKAGGKAKMIDGEREFRGLVTRSNMDGKNHRYNISFEFPNGYLMLDGMEFLIFDMIGYDFTPDQRRVIGYGWTEHDGVRYLEQGKPNHKIKCSNAGL